MKFQHGYINGIDVLLSVREYSLLETLCSELDHNIEEDERCRNEAIEKSESSGIVMVTGSGHSIQIKW